MKKKPSTKPVKAPPTHASAASSTRMTRQSVDETATALRLELAEALRSQYLRRFDREAAATRISKSPFAQYVTDFPAADAVKLLDFNLSLTDAAVGHLLERCDEPEELLFTASRVAEQGMYQLHDPEGSQNPIQFLGASKDLGYFFTPPEVATLMAKRLIGSGEPIQRLLDPAAGMGSLLGAVAIQASLARVSINEIVAIEFDPHTAMMLQRILNRLRDLLSARWRVHVINDDALQVMSRWSAACHAGHDRIIMNPPYGRAKFLRSTLTNAETRVQATVRSLEEQAESRRTAAAKRAAELRKVSETLALDQGAQDLHRVFFGSALSSLSAAGKLVLISPSSWLGDRESRLLRRKLISERALVEVIVYPEDAGWFATVNQPTAVTVVDRHESVRDHFTMSVLTQRSASPDAPYQIAFADVERHDPDLLRIPRLPGKLQSILMHLQCHARVKDLKGLKNLRGELDQTMDSGLFRASQTALRLIRGDHVERYIVRPPEYSDLPSYVCPVALGSSAKQSPKYSDMRRQRIVGRQCSYMKKGRRLSFAIADGPAALGNSCNYLCEAADAEHSTVRLEAITVVLNSFVTEWYFRVFSANNHVANYEIADLPLCLRDHEVVLALSQCYRFLKQAYSDCASGGKDPSPLEDIADALVAHSFGLTPEQSQLLGNEIAPDRASRISGMVDWLTRHGLDTELFRGDGSQLHVAPRLSSLDQEIISHVPQGGNWQDIPSTVPSQRLAQIREMTAERGVVRTTYYGRLRPDQPAYTIATYYNRPGNGTNIHPWEARTLTSREAARLQSFPDYYWFAGTEGAVRKQIGNAVPPLLGAAVGAQLRLATKSRLCVDLFAGAGGLSLGLEMAGWEVAVAVDNDDAATSTYRLNRPCDVSHVRGSTATLSLIANLSDIRAKKETIAAIQQQLAGRPLGLLAGGPPCQGYSHAGWRSEGDKRNDLAVGYMEIVEALSPDVVLLENVEGLLTFSGGKVVADLLKTLRELGYDTGQSPWKLNAEEFGVPQMRRRVFLIAQKNGHSLVPPPALLTKCPGRRKGQVSNGLFGSLPAPVTVAEALIDLPPLANRNRGACEAAHVRDGYSRWLRGLLTYPQLIESFGGNLIEIKSRGGRSEQRPKQRTDLSMLRT